MANCICGRPEEWMVALTAGRPPALRPPATALRRSIRYSVACVGVFEYEGHIKVAQLLSTYGANINSLSTANLTPLYLA
jgi:hypothetical protein